MSIHEVVYGPRGAVKSHRCLDEEIDQAFETTRFPSIAQTSEVKTVFEPDDKKRAITQVTKVTAMSLDSVRVEEFVMGFTENNGYHKMITSNRTLVGEKINNANLKIGNKGLVYTESPVFVARKR